MRRHTTIILLSPLGYVISRDVAHRVSSEYEQTTRIDRAEKFRDPPPQQDASAEEISSTIE